MKALLLVLSSILILFGATWSASAADDRTQDITHLTALQVTALQRRLTDAQCYSGPIDGIVDDATKQAVVVCPDQRPQLRIETGMHVASISRISADRDCRFAATASNDKTVRLWSLPDGQLLRTLRWPVGAGDDGKAYAVAVSPDGRFVAAGGNVAGSHGNESVYIFEATTGALVTRAGSFGDVVDNIVFSRDGRWLAVTLGRGFGVSMIDTSDWRVVAQDDKYGDEVDSLGATFSSDGHLYTVADNGKIRKYSPGPAFRLENKPVMAKGAKKLLSIDFDPISNRLVVGFDQTIGVDFYDAETLAYRGNADLKAFDNGDLSSAAWRADGRAVLVGGSFDRNGQDPHVLLDERGHPQTQTFPPLATDTIQSIQRCGAGFVMASSDPGFGLLHGTGKAILWKRGVGVRMTSKLNTAFTISPDAKRVRFGLEKGGDSPVVFDLVKADLTDSPAAEPGFIEPQVTGMPVNYWRYDPKPEFDKKTIPLDTNEHSQSLAIRGDNTGFVLGGDYTLRAFDKQGVEQWKKDMPEVVWGVNLSADGRVIVAACGDGTIRWIRASDKAELLALFINKAARSWIAWTPSGYYSASPGAEDMIGWQVNRGWGQIADFFPASRFHDTYARPDIVERILDTLDEGKAIEAADAARHSRGVDAGSGTDRLPPVVTILSPADGTNIGGTEAKIDFLLRSPSGLPIDSLDAVIDGTREPARRGDLADDLKQCLVETHGLGRNEGGLQGCPGSITISLPPGQSQIGLFAKAGDRVSDVTRTRITRGIAASATELRKPMLAALVIGISAYNDPDYKLDFAAKDANDFAGALLNQKQGPDGQPDSLYGDVVVNLLTDGKATQRAIEDGFDWLARHVTNKDIGVLYLAGHGVLDDHDRFYFLAADSDADRLRATGVSMEDIYDALNTLNGKAFLFLDACHAGAVASMAARTIIDINTVVNDVARIPRGVVAFTASTGRQLSQERPEWNNGAFTKAVVEGIGLRGVKGKADFLGDGEITTSELDVYVTRRVKFLTQGEQIPVMIRPPTIPDFAMASSKQP